MKLKTVDNIANGVGLVATLISLCCGAVELASTVREGRKEKKENKDKK